MFGREALCMFPTFPSSEKGTVAKHLSRNKAVKNPAEQLNGRS